MTHFRITDVVSCGKQFNLQSVRFVLTTSEQ